MGRSRRLLVDTNIIIEAVRTGCWDGLRGHYDLVTVETCRDEARSGRGRIPGYVAVEDRHLSAKIEVVPVNDTDRARLITTCQDAMILDEGERDLWAHANSRADDWQAVTADRAAIRVAMLLGWGERLVALEVLVKDGGIRLKHDLKSQYTNKWLVQVRTEFKLGL